tara:strand:- start:475 stop:714 length:240 start_codon:yes stop_codon:yes gene_type:complete
MKKFLNFLKMMHLDHFNSIENNELKSIDELKALRIRKQRIENDKKARKYILEINQRYRVMTDKKSKHLFKKINPFRRVA